MKEYEAEIIENKQIAEGVHSLRFRLPEEAKTRAGQFANLSVGGAHLLRRPLAICKTDGREITVCFQIKGEGTKLLASMGQGRVYTCSCRSATAFLSGQTSAKWRWWAAAWEYSR